jgi:hypothetical protein
MKQLLVLVILTTLIFACDDKDANLPKQEEKILSINHIKTLDECDDFTYCIYELKVDEDSVITIKRAMENSNLIDVVKSYSNLDIKVDSISNLLDFNKISINEYITDCNIIDEGCYELKIITNFREINVKYGELPIEFLELDIFLRMKRNNYEF